MKSKSNEPTQQRLASIDVFEQTLVASVYDGPRVLRKIIEPSDAVEVFSSAGILARKGEIQWLDAFGRQAVRVGLCSNGDCRILAVRPARRTCLIMKIGRAKPKRMTVSLPNLMAELTFRGGRWAKLSRLFAFWGRLTSKTVLMMPPLPNTSDGGKFCMGDIRTSAAEQLDAGVYLESVLFDTPFTDHYLEAPLKQPGKIYRNVWHLLTATGGRNIRRHLKREGTYGQLFA